MRPSLLAAAALALLVPGVVRANCALANVYSVEAVGNTVEIQAYSERGCGAGEVLLRQAVPGGETVRVAEFCGPAAGDGWIGLPYLDECVPPGTYRYGFERPFECNRGACGNDRWAEVVVTADVQGCTRSEGNAGPTPAEPVSWGLWGVGEHVCSREDEGLGCSTAGASGAVLLLDAAALALGWALLRRRRRA